MCWKMARSVSQKDDPPKADGEVPPPPEENFVRGFLYFFKPPQPRTAAAPPPRRAVNDCRVRNVVVESYCKAAPNPDRRSEYEDAL